MPATSKQQQKLFGLALSVKDGDTPRSEVSKSVLDIVDKMSRKEIEKFAGTKHKGLPDKKEIYSMKESIRSIIRNEILNMKNKFMFEANFQKGDNVRIKKNAKNVTDPKNLGKAGVILNKDGRHYMVKLPNAQLLVSPSDLELMPESKLSEGVMKDIHTMAKSAKDESDFVSKFLKKYSKQVKDTPSTRDWASSLYKDVVMKRETTESHTPSHPNAAKLDRIADKLSNLELKGKENTPEYKKLDKMYKDLEKKVKESVNEGKFNVDDLVYNKRTKTVGIVRMGDDRYGEVKTDADGNVDVDELEKYNPIKFKHQRNAKVAPSTEKEVNKRGLFNPFKMESVNEAASRTAMEIGGLTGMNKDAIQKFVDDNNLDIEKVYQYVKKSKLPARMDFVTAIAGKPNNPIQKKMIKMFGESVVNESDVKTKMNRRGDVDGLIVTHKGNDYEIVYSSDFTMSGAVQPYGIVMPGDDVVSFLGKDKKAKSIWKQLKPKVDKFVKSNESVNEARKINPASKKFLKGMKKIKVKGLGGWMPGIDYVYVDGDKYYFVDFEGDHMELRNNATIKQLKKVHGSELGESANDLKEVKVHFEKKLKNGNIFQVIDRDTKGMRGTQDKFLMQIVDTSGKVVKRIGSHPSLDGAKKFSNSVNEAPKLKITNTISKKAWEKTHKDYKSVIDGIPYVLKMTDNGTALVPVKIVESVNSRGIDSPIKLSSLISEASKVFWDDKKDAKWWHHAPSPTVVGIFNPKTWSTVDGYLYQTNDANHIKLKPGEEIFRYESGNTLFGARPLIKVDKRRGLVYFLKPVEELYDKIEFESKGIPVRYMRFIKGLVKEYRRYDPYRDDPRWIKAKFAGTDKNGNSFKRGEKVLYYPKTKAILSGKDADKAWREFQSMASDEFMMGAGYKPKGNSLSEDIVESMIRVTERVSVDDSPYKRVHGKSPRGFGTWAFSFNDKGDNQFFTPGPMNFNQAIKWAKDKAVSTGAYSVYVLG